MVGTMWRSRVVITLSERSISLQVIPGTLLSGAGNGTPPKVAFLQRFDFFANEGQSGVLSCGKCKLEYLFSRTLPLQYLS